jgi:AraC-like DNA-binding protein
MKAATVEEMSRAPVGRYVTFRTTAHFCATPGLWGLIIWGDPNEEDAYQLGRSLVLELNEPAVPHVSYIDASRIARLDAGAFKALQLYTDTFKKALARQVRRLALVRPTGMDGATVAGVFDIIHAPYPVQVFDDKAKALTWLDDESCSGEPKPSSMADVLEAIYGQASSTPLVVSQLRSLLDENLAGPSVKEAARTLALSERTLQRRLSAAGTTFQDELGEARLRAAKRLLRASDAPLTSIALDVGCASLQHFSQLFRRLTGESPSAWRERNRG